MAYSCSPMMKPNVRGPNLAAVRDRLSIRKRSTLRKEYLLLPNDHKELTGDHRVPRPSRVSFAPATRKLAVSALPIDRGHVSIGVSTDATNCRRFRLPFLHGRILDFRGHDSGSPGSPMSTRVPRRDAVLRLRQLLICQQPFAYCDACLAFHLDVSRDDANAAALALSSEAGYARERRDCYGCRRTVQMTSMSIGKVNTAAKLR